MSLREFLNLVPYVSPTDQFLTKFDQTHPTLSASQQQEIKKYQQVYDKRDNPRSTTPQQSFWDNF